MPGERRRGRGGGPKHLGDVIDGLVSRGRKGRWPREVRARKKWGEVVGPEVEEQTAVESLKRGVLKVRVGSSALLAELDGFYKKELILAMASGERPVAVRDIKFVLSER